MGIDFLTVFIAVLSLIVLAVPGFILAKAKMLPEKTDEALSSIVLYVAQPVLIFMSFQKHYKPEIAINILIVAGLTVLIHAVMLVIIYLCIRNKSQSAKINTARYACLFSNCGYMGLPFLQTVFKDSPFASEIIIYTAIVIAIFNFFNWTIGVYMLGHNKKDVSVKKILLNPTIISIFVGLIFFFTVKVPLVDLFENGSSARLAVAKIMDSFDVIGNLVTPLALTVIGIRLAHVKPKNLFLDKWAYLVCLFKLIIMSVVSILIVAYMPVDTLLKYVMFFLLSMPSATSTTMFSLKFGGDADSGAVFVLLSTVLSILTIPLMFLLMNGVFVPM